MITISVLCHNYKLNIYAIVLFLVFCLYCDMTVESRQSEVGERKVLESGFKHGMPIMQRCYMLAHLPARLLALTVYTDYCICNQVFTILMIIFPIFLLASIR